MAITYLHLFLILNIKYKAFVDRRTGFNELFSEEEIAFYSEAEEFFDKLKFFKQNPQARMKSAQKGHTKIHDEFSCKNIAKYMADLLFEDKTSIDKPWKIIL